MASSKDKAIALKDSYVDGLIKDGVTKPVQGMPETDYGEVALDPITAAVGIAALGSAAMYHLPEINNAVGGYFGDEGAFRNDQQNRGRSLLKTFGIGDYDKYDYNDAHFDRTGEIKPYTAEEKACRRKATFPDQQC